MELLLRRLWPSANSTIGVLYVNGGADASCYTLELPWKDNLSGQSCIPVGSYPVELSWSERFQREMPHVMNVPDRSEIEIHFGNTAKDTEGCILVGETRGVDVIHNSVMAFTEIFPKIQAAWDAKEPITLTVTGSDGSADWPNS